MARKKLCNPHEGQGRGLLIEVLQSALLLVKREGNDFTFTHWNDAPEAVRELEMLLKKVRRSPSGALDELVLLFGPTGALQELSLSSGWSDEYLALAHRFDEAVSDPFVHLTRWQGLALRVLNRLQKWVD